MDRSLFLYDTTLGILRGRLRVLGHDIYTFDEDLILIGKYFEDFPGLLGVLIVSGDDYHAVTFFNIELGFESVTHFILTLPACGGEFNSKFCLRLQPSSKVTLDALPPGLQYFRRQGNDLHISLIAQLPGDRSEDTGAAGFIRRIQQYHRIIIEGDITAVLAT